LEGKIEERIDLVIKMLKSHRLSMEEIAVYSGFTLAEILNIKKAWNRKNKQRAQIKIPQII
jgi:transcriptional regulator GlxA family with amidase domain